MFDKILSVTELKKLKNSNSKLLFLCIMHTSVVGIYWWLVIDYNYIYFSFRTSNCYYNYLLHA